MNASARLFVTAAWVGAAGLLAGCGGNPFADAKIDPGSPIVDQINAAKKIDRPYPKFTDIPKMPKDVRSAKAYGASEQKLLAARDDLDRETADNTWSLNDTAKFAAGAEAAAGPDTAPSVQDAAATEAFARKLRERATPPPPASK